MKRRFKVGKLIRDKIPECMSKTAVTAITRTLERSEYTGKLLDKLVEEVTEVTGASTDATVLEELADCLEVITALARVYGYELTDLLEIAQQKRQEKGGFDNRIYLDLIELDSNNPRVDFYLTKPNEYVEILK